MNKLTTFFHTRAFLSDMLVRYSAHNRILEDENTKLRKKLGAKDNVLQRAIDDHAQSDKFHQQVINNLQTTINSYRAKRESDLVSPDEPEISFTLPNGVKLVAEYNNDASWESIDIVAHGPNGRFENVCCADYDKGDDDLPSKGLRIFCFNGFDEEYCYEQKNFDFSYLLGQDDLSPKTEQDYIDQVVERQVEEHDALEAQKG